MSCSLLAGDSPAHEPRNLVFISLDTVRRDHLPIYGYSRATAPSVERLARTATVFENAYTQDTNTNPSHTSMFTGVYPHVHGSRKNGLRLADDQVTLAQILKRVGFRTGGFVSGLPMHRWLSGLDRGFDVYNDRLWRLRRKGSDTADAALDWLSQLPADEHWFLFVHLYDAHGPYKPEGRYAKMFESKDLGPALKSIPEYQLVNDSAGNPMTHLNGYVDRYDAMIRYLDDQVAKILEKIDLSDTIVVILSDHGETLGERYRVLDHGGQVFDEQTRIPLVIHAPGQQPRRVAATLETIDLLPTLLSLLGVAVPADRPVQGKNLLPLVQRASAGGREFSFSSATVSEERHADRGYRLDSSRYIHSIRSSRWKLILYPARQQDYFELYDLEADAAERENVANQYPRVRNEYHVRLRSWAAGGKESEPHDSLTPEMRERLEALGYGDG
jgi:arylsulfatase A-like enzyme